MKILFSATLTFLSFVIFSILPSCTKEKVVTVVDTDTITIHDTLRTVFNDTSKLGLLTRKQWIIDTVYNNYTGPGTGTLVYARGGANNTYNFDLVRTIYWTGGNIDGYNSIGAYYPYTWHFNGTDSTSYLINSTSFPTVHAKILKLDATHFNVYDSASNTLDIQIFKP